MKALPMLSVVGWLLLVGNYRTFLMDIENFTLEELIRIAA